MAVHLPWPVSLSSSQMVLSGTSSNLVTAAVCKGSGGLAPFSVHTLSLGNLIHTHTLILVSLTQQCTSLDCLLPLLTYPSIRKKKSMVDL